jgi:sulfur transfer complex TusBCD TusB component (DsrH family)
MGLFLFNGVYVAVKYSEFQCACLLINGGLLVLQEHLLLERAVFEDTGVHEN